ncbi:hypothetical protein RB600_006442 [Gaeumannomyces tritici]
MDYRTAFLFLFVATVQAAPSSQRCSAIPGGPVWPTAVSWHRLNETVGGRLTATVPAASVRHIGGPFNGRYDKAKCEQLKPLWNFPVGHYLGKSTGKGGLALWTRNLNKTEIIVNYSSTFYSGPAIKLGAGVLAVEAYLAAHERGYRVVGGTCATVGIAGGYSQGGGHSALSSVHGPAADNVLAWEVVTPAGEHLVATPESYRDLYWALSGGGGTFAVVLSMIARLHPDGPVGGAYLRFSDTRLLDNDIFWGAVGSFHAALPPLLAREVSALYSVTNSTFDMFSLTVTDKDGTQVRELLAPVLSQLERRGVPFEFDSHLSPDFLTHFARDPGPLLYGYIPSGQVTGGRLIPRSVLGNPSANAAVTRVLRNITATNDFMSVSRPWTPSRPRAAMDAKQALLTNVYTPMLEAVTPGSGKATTGRTGVQDA